ncbi:MAG: GLUG motif-containing protein [Candidatus Natronoplasma sp.]
MKMKKNLTLGVTILLILSVFAAAVGSAGSLNESEGVTVDDEIDSAQPVLSEGDGTFSDPNMIYDVQDLQDMKNDLTGHYALANDIDASETSGWNGGDGFEPIGSETDRFEGSLDGHSHTINALYIDRTDTDHIGLFGFTNTSASISNVSLENAHIAGKDWTGGLIGRNYGNISGCSFEGEVSATSRAGGIASENNGMYVNNTWSDGYVNSTGNYCGGLFGYNSGALNNTSSNAVVSGTTYVGGLLGYSHPEGMITNSHASGDVLGTSDYAGGFAGYNNAAISDSYSTGNVNGLDDVAGFVGKVDGNSDIDRCYATGDTTGQHRIGGFIGSDYDNGNQGEINDCYATGNVHASGGYIGGFVGEAYGKYVNSYSTGYVSADLTSGGFIGKEWGGSITTNCFYDNVTSGMDTSDGGTPKNTTDMMTESTFTDAGWDFTDIWWMVDGETRPFLRMEWSTEIRNSHQLQMMQMDLTKDYTLTNDIDLTGYITEASRMWGTNLSAGAGFVPVGNDTARFTGSLDGYNHTITGLYIDKPSDHYIGLFGQSSGSISNIVLQDSDVTGWQHTGGFVGSNNGTIVNCGFDGTVIAYQTWYAGGIAGSNMGTGIVINCTSTGDVGHGGGMNSGGIAGNNQGIISNSHSSMTVRGHGSIGGLVGWHSSNGEILNSSAHGDVNGNPTSSDIGGLVGRNTAHIYNSSAGGDVNGGNNVGGLVGWNDYGTVSGSYSSSNVSGDNRLGGLVGWNDYGMVSDSYASNNVSGNDDVGGLVGWNRDGTVLNSYAAGDVSGYNKVGGLVGYGSYSTVNNSYATGDVTGNDDVGGLVGYNSDTLSNSYATGNVSGNGDVGGLVGDNRGDSAVVEKSYAAGDVNGSSNVGGLVGYSYKGKVENSYATSNVNGTDDVGGLVGRNYYGTVNTSYAAGDVNGSSNVGGLVGFNQTSIVENSYWDLNTTGQSSSEGGTGKTTAEMKMKSTFTNWNFTAIWNIREPDSGFYSYPFLQNNMQDPVPGEEEVYVEHIEIVPSDDQTITAGETIDFNATAYDQYGHLITDVDTDFIWENTDNTGLFTGTIAGDYDITATYDEVTSPITVVTVEPAGVDYVEITLSEDQTITAGDTIDFEAEAYDEFGNLITEDDTDFTWENTDNTGLFDETRAGDYHVTATYDEVTSPITVVTVEAAGVDYVEIDIAEDQTITAGDTIDFNATAYDEYDNVVEDDDAEFTWQNTEGTGLFDETEAGDYDVTATYDTVTSPITVVTVEAAEADYIVVEPDTATITAGESQVYTATAYDQYDNEIGDVTDDTSWSDDVDPTDASSWTDNTLTVEEAGEWTITGTYDDLTDTATLIVEDEEIDGYEVRVGPVKDNAGDPVEGASVELSWGGSETATTDSDGMAVFTLDFDPSETEFTYNITHEDLDEPLTRTFNGDDSGEIQVDIGEASADEEDEPSETGSLSGYWWIIPLLIIIAVIAVVFMMKGSKKEPIMEEEIDEGDDKIIEEYSEEELEEVEEESEADEFVSEESEEPISESLETEEEPKDGLNEDI